MRLAESEQGSIVTAVLAFDASAEIYLFGSRTKDELRGGDIDLLVVSSHCRRSICDFGGVKRPIGRSEDRPNDLRSKGCAIGLHEQNHERGGKTELN